MPTILGQEITRRDLQRYTGSLSQVFGVDLITMANGPERANRVLRFRSGSGLEFDLMIDRAMDIAGLNYCGVPITWHSPAGFRNPWLHEHDSEDGFGWFRSMSGLLNTCGLDHIHAPERDTGEAFHHPPRPTIGHGLHGRIAYTPARLVGYGARWEGDRCWLYADAEISQATVFGENLVLERRVEVEVGDDTIEMRDTVRNRGFDPTPHAYLWHINMGWPLLSEDSEVVAAIAETAWQLRDDLGDERGFRLQSAPSHPVTQQVFDHRLHLDDDGTARAALVNPRFAFADHRGLALEIAYDGVVMPSLFQWRHFQSGNYVVALEPCTTHHGSRADWRQRGEFRLLDHDDTAAYRLSLTPHLGGASIAELRNRLKPV